MVEILHHVLISLILSSQQHIGEEIYVVHYTKPIRTIIYQ
jgi:hypothetical protein